MQKYRLGGGGGGGGEGRVSLKKKIPLSSPLPPPRPVMDYLICLKYPLIFNILVCSPELSPLELSAFLNALPCSLAFHRDASFKFLNLIKEVRSGL